MSEKNEKIIVGKCPWCDREIKEIDTAKGKMWVHEERTDECSFVLFEKTLIMGSKVQLDSEMIKSLLNGESIKFSLISKNGNPYEANIILGKKPKEYKGKEYPDFSIESFVSEFEEKEKNEEKQEELDDPFPAIE